MSLTLILSVQEVLIIDLVDLCILYSKLLYEFEKGFLDIQYGHNIWCWFSSKPQIPVSKTKLRIFYCFSSSLETLRRKVSGRKHQNMLRVVEVNHHKEWDFSFWLFEGFYCGFTAIHSILNTQPADIWFTLERYNQLSPWHSHTHHTGEKPVFWG